MVYGGAKGMKDFLVVTLGTGLGSGFVANGKLIYGHDGFAGELGHVVVNKTGRICGCGRKGCLETYASATGIKRTVFKLLADHTDDSEFRRVTYDDLTAEMITKAALNGDPIAIEAYEYTGKLLGEALADAVAITSPEAIFLFGGLAKAGKYIFEPTKKYMEQNLLAIFRNKVKLLPSGIDGKKRCGTGCFGPRMAEPSGSTGGQGEKSAGLLTALPFPSHKAVRCDGLVFAGDTFCVRFTLSITKTQTQHDKPKI